MLRINIGCGQTPIEGWLNFENSCSLYLSKIPLLHFFLHKLGLLETPQYKFISFARTHNIKYGDAVRGLPIASSAASVIYCSHMIEHLDQNGAAAFLREARRLLCPEGIIRIAVPDLNKLVKQYILSRDANAFIASTNLCNPVPRSLFEKFKFLFVGPRHHQWMYDGVSMCRLLQQSGFVNAQILEGGQTTIKNSQPLDLYERISESVYVEAENPKT